MLRVRFLCQLLFALTIVGAADPSIAQPAPAAAPSRSGPPQWMRQTTYDQFSDRLSDLLHQVIFGDCPTPAMEAEAADLEQKVDQVVKRVDVAIDESIKAHRSDFDPVEKDFIRHSDHLKEMADALRKHMDRRIKECWQQSPEQVEPPALPPSEVVQKGYGPPAKPAQPARPKDEPAPPYVYVGGIPAGSCEVNGVKMDCTPEAKGGARSTPPPSPTGQQGATPPNAPETPVRILVDRLWAVRDKFAHAGCATPEVRQELEQIKQEADHLRKAVNEADAGGMLDRAVAADLATLQYDIRDTERVFNLYQSRCRRPQTSPPPPEPPVTEPAPAGGQAGPPPPVQPKVSVGSSTCDTPAGTQACTNEVSETIPPAPPRMTAGATSAPVQPSPTITTARPSPAAAEDSSLQAKIGELYKIYKLINDDRARYGVPPLKWDDQLAQHAQEWVDQLAKMGRMEHAPRDGRGAERENIAQGLPWWSTERLVEEWRGEEKNYVPGKFPNVALDGHWEKVAHWTQDISRLSQEIGCAIARGSGFLWLDCRFSPGGNKDGEDFGPRLEQPKLAPAEVVANSGQGEAPNATAARQQESAGADWAQAVIDRPYVKETGKLAHYADVPLPGVSGKAAEAEHPQPPTVYDATGLAATGGVDFSGLPGAVNAIGASQLLDDPFQVKPPPATNFYDYSKYDFSRPWELPAEVQTNVEPPSLPEAEDLQWHPQVELVPM
jgi:hypothetical protein